MKNHHVWHPFTGFSSFRDGSLPMITGGKGIYLYDEKGSRYLDAISSWWCCALGHGHPRLIKAIQEQADRLQHAILGHLNNPWADELAARLCRTMPSGDRHVMFASDGSCAVDAALKIAVQYHHNRGVAGRNRFLTLEEDYHGDTIGAVGVGYVPAFHEPFRPILRRAVTVPLPDYKTGPGFGFAEEAIEKHGKELAAVIVEPLVQGAAGMRMYDSRFLSDLEALCRKRDIVLIVDEIAMGFGRTGRYWAFEHAGIDPDIVCAGKAVTGGYLPLSATVCRDHLYETFTDMNGPDNTLYHGHTFSGNPIASACALEAMNIYDEMNIAQKVSALGALLKKNLSPLHDHPQVKEVRCIGLIGAVELEPSENSGPRAKKIREHLRDRGILLRPLGNVFYIMPPFIITEEELEVLCKSFADAITSLA